MKHTIHLKISPNDLTRAIDAILMHPDLAEPSSLTGVVRTCFNIGVAALNPTTHLKDASQRAADLYKALQARTNQTISPSDAVATLQRSAKAISTPEVDHTQICDLPPDDQPKAERILAAIRAGLSVEAQINSTNPEVRRIAKLLFQPSNTVATYDSSPNSSEDK